MVGAVTGGVLQLIDAEYYEMRPEVKAVEQIETTKRALDTREQIMAAQADLTASFGGYPLLRTDDLPAECEALTRSHIPSSCVAAGGKAKKAKLSAATQYRTDEDSISTSHGLTASTLTKADAASAADKDAARLVPPYNKSATVPSEAYPLEKSQSPFCTTALLGSVWESCRVHPETLRHRRAS